MFNHKCLGIRYINVIYQMHLFFRSISWSLPVLTKEKERTVIADILHWVPKKQNHTTFTFLDLGGHVSYRHSGHFFYINSSNNISLFFHDITSSSIDDTLWWIHSGLTKAPKSEVVFVVTKIDLIEDEQERQQKIDEFKKRIEDFLEKVKSLQYYTLVS